MVRPGTFETILVPYEQQAEQKDALEVTTVSSTKAIASKPYERRDDRTIFVGNLPISINQKILTNAIEKVVDRTAIRSIRLSMDVDGEE